MPEFINQGRALLAQLVSNTGWLNQTLANLVLDESFLQAQYQSGDPNDTVLFRSPSRAFSVRCFIWLPNWRYPIHDHGSWGIIGAYSNQIQERKYRRLDNGSQEGYAEVELDREAVLEPGQTSYVLPLNDGLHQMEAVNGKTALTVHVYGNPVRKGYFQQYDPHHKAVHRIYPPQLQKQALVISALSHIPESWAEDVLRDAAHTLASEYMANEARQALDKLARRE